MVGRGGEQVHLVALGVGGAHGLAVHHDRDQLSGVVLTLACGVLACGVLPDQPGADHRVHRCGIGSGDHPPDGGHRWWPGSLTVELRQQFGRHVGDPTGDREERPHAATTAAAHNDRTTATG
ncbi:MAG: hypothetical protein LC799_27920 [Actinobacteria bacterium]|nr:hypothetical protein [Actinomycetota bacterium]